MIYINLKYIEEKLKKVEDPKMDILHIYFSIRGRIGRRTYWYAIIPIIIVCAVANVMTVSPNPNTAAIGFIIMVALLWPTLAVQTKRFHDRNKSGWWNLMALVPFFGHIWITLECGFLDSMPGTNQYDLNRTVTEVLNNSSRASYWERANIAEKLDQPQELVGSGSGSRTNSWRNS